MGYNMNLQVQRPKIRISADVTLTSRVQLEQYAVQNNTRLSDMIRFAIKKVYGVDCEEI